MSTDLRWVLHSQDHEFPPGRLADDLIAEDRGEATERFIDWAIRMARTAKDQS